MGFDFRKNYRNLDEDVMIRDHMVAAWMGASN